MGVCWIEQHQVWRAMITHNNRRIFIGHFKTAEMAHEAYEAKRAELFTHDEGRHLTQPAPAPLSDDAVQKTWALLDELEKLRGADRYDEDWGTLNKRDDELRAALTAQKDTP